MPFLPEVVNLQTDAAVVDFADALHNLFGERWHIRGGYVGVDLARAFRAGDGARVASRCKGEAPGLSTADALLTKPPIVMSGAFCF